VRAVAQAWMGVASRPPCEEKEHHFLSLSLSLSQLQEQRDSCNIVDKIQCLALDRKGSGVVRCEVYPLIEVVQQC
jgi:hypothetical protein